MTVSTKEFNQLLDECNQRLWQAIGLSVLALILWFATESGLLKWILLAFVAFLGGLAWAAFIVLERRRREYEKACAILEGSLCSQEIASIRGSINGVELKAENDEFLASLLRELRPRLDRHLDEVTRKSLQLELSREVESTRLQASERIDQAKNQVPIVIARNTVDETLTRLKTNRQRIVAEWARAYETFSRWNKIWYGPDPDLREMDETIKQLEDMRRRLLTRHKDDFAKLDAHFAELKSRAEARIAESQQKIARFIEVESSRERSQGVPLKAALWLSALSVPASLWLDFTKAGDVYDALRGVNGNYAGLSDAEIWWETLLMPAESLVGLAALTKGAYFEQLVAADTGGRLFEHFNHPGTDIVIDGQAFQLKATASAGYVNSVDENIPVIATSEVAEQTRAIDAGFSNAELENSVDLALGGSVFDIKDTTVDAVLSGIGGLGLFATIQGINHAGKRVENGGDVVEAMFEGAGVAIVGTARALVGTAELGYKVLSSRPSRFVGRVLLAGLKKLDDKIMEQQPPQK